MDFNNNKNIIFSGIQPSGVFTLGNYLGAIKNWSTLQDDYNSIFSVVNMHSLTVKQDPEKLREQTLCSYALILACGIDIKKSLVFMQSQVQQHSELAWILACNTQFGELARMTQFKDKSCKYPENINAGLFTYPVLMAADILLYNTTLVPVGIDQKQHLELARNIAIRFNHMYGETFKVPEPYISKVGAKVMSLQDPTKKMSKTDTNVNGVVSILDDKDTIIKKFKKAVTDSDNEIRYSEEKKGISNLLSIYSTITNKSIKECEKEFSNCQYGKFKIAVGETVADCLKNIQQNYNHILKNKDELNKISLEHAEIAKNLAQKTMTKVNKKIGLIF